PNDPYLRLLERMSLLPAMPIPGSGRASFQPIWAQDVARCVLAAIPGGSPPAEARRTADGADRVRHLGRGRAAGGVVDLAARGDRRTAPGRDCGADAGGAGKRL